MNPPKPTDKARRFTYGRADHKRPEYVPRQDGEFMTIRLNFEEQAYRELTRTHPEEAGDE